VTSWYTEKSGQYARIYETTAAETAGNAITDWDGLPTYAGVHEISATMTDVYIRSSNLGFHVMGPWYLDEAKTNIFPNQPGNRAILYRFPRTPVIPGTKTATTPGAIGYFVDGIAMFDSTDTFSYDTSGGGDQTPVNSLSGDGVWNRDAYINEGVTFDAANAHQAGTQHHYHANPPALRHLLGDSVDYDTLTNRYNTPGYYFGDPTGSTEATIPGEATVHFEGGPEIQETGEVSHDVTSDDITITWSAIEGGSYQVKSSSDAANWDDEGPSFTSESAAVSFVESAETRKFYQLQRLGITAFNDTGFDYDSNLIIGGGGGGSGEFTATFNTAVTPPFPPAGVTPTSITINGLTGTFVSHTIQGQITFTFDDAALPSGSYSAQVQFAMPPTPFTSTNQYTKP
jgi:hypothetical protein